MRVEIWSDIVCPWCYIGKRRFEKALAQFDGRDEVEVIWRSFQLDPTREIGAGGSVYENLAKKYGRTIEEARAMTAQTAATAAGEGLSYDFDRYHPINTFDAHRLLHLAQEAGVQNAVKERFLRAQFTEGENLERPDTLVRLAAEAGLPEAEARRVLASDEYADEVRADIREMQELGGNGVPFFVIDGRYGVYGAQPAELLLNALETAYRDRVVVAD